MNRFKRHANACSSTTLPSKPLNRFAMTEMTTTTAHCSGENDSCDSLGPSIPGGSVPGRALGAHGGTLRMAICAGVGISSDPRLPGR